MRKQHASSVASENAEEKSLSGGTSQGNQDMGEASRGPPFKGMGEGTPFWRGGVGHT